jgi:hypothetical protein
MKIIHVTVLLCFSCLFSCSPNKKTENQIAENQFEKGTFGYDLEFLKAKDSIIVLAKGDAQIIVSPKYQGKVFTSTAAGLSGNSFGWINYKALGSDSIAPHINAYGGEDRMWLGPEGGQYSIFFKPGSKMIFDDWQTPAGLDTESWEKISASTDKVSMQKSMQLQNYSGTEFDVLLKRDVKLLASEDLLTNLGIKPDSSVKWVGFETSNTLTNAGKKPWTKESGTLSIWILSMLNPIDNGAVVIPYREGDIKTVGPVATTNYFGEIPADRIQMKEGILYFKVDGKHRSKLGLTYNRATSFAGSYDIDNKTLTILQLTLPEKEKEYINQLWEVQKEPFKGDAINSYNDGPLDGGGQIGPFYELESSSPAAFLAPGESINHIQRMYHFVGTEEQLNVFSNKILGVSIEQVKSAFKK